MPPEERDKALLYDMPDESRHPWRMWQGQSAEDLLTDRTLQWATDGYRRGRASHIGHHKNCPSRERMASHRGLAQCRRAHYGDVDYTRHWHVIQYELPRMMEELEKPGL